MKTSKKKKKKLDKNFIEKGIETISNTDFETVFNKKDQLFAKINHPNWKKYKDKIILMFQMLKDVKQKKYPETPWKTISAMVFTILYIINPLDLVPDFIPFLGYLDDISVFSFVLKLINDDLMEYKNWRTAES
jgi:uncharacterized membrane protein YkvA (DUF1232 family)